MLELKSTWLVSIPQHVIYVIYILAYIFPTMAYLVKIIV